MSSHIGSCLASRRVGGRRVVPPDVCDTEYATNTALKIVTSILNYYLPLALMYALYTKIFVEASTFHLTALTTFTQQCIAPADGVHSVTLIKAFFLSTDSTDSPPCLPGILVFYHVVFLFSTF